MATVPALERPTKTSGLQRRTAWLRIGIPTLHGQIVGQWVTPRQETGKHPLTTARSAVPSNLANADFQIRQIASDYYATGGKSGRTRSSSIALPVMCATISLASVAALIYSIYSCGAHVSLAKIKSLSCRALTFHISELATFEKRRPPTIGLYPISYSTAEKDHCHILSTDIRPLADPDEGKVSVTNRKLRKLSCICRRSSIIENR